MPARNSAPRAQMCASAGSVLSTLSVASAAASETVSPP